MSTLNDRHWLAWARNRRVRAGLSIVLAVIVGLAVWKALTIPNDASKRAEQRLREDNQQVCIFMHRLDAALGVAFEADPTTAAGSNFQKAFVGVQQAARDVTMSRVCPPPGPEVP